MTGVFKENNEDGVVAVDEAAANFDDRDLGQGPCAVILFSTAKFRLC